MRYLSVSFLLLLVIVTVPPHAYADMYKWTDKYGTVHYSSQPDDPSAELVKENELPTISETALPASDLVPDKTVYPGEFMATIFLHLDGKPLSDFTSATPELQLYNRELRHWFTPEYSYDVLTGTLHVKNIAKGKYWSQLSVYTRQKTYGEYPGDYKGRVGFTVASDSQTVVTADLERIIHLTSPQDNSKPLNERMPCVNPPEFESPVIISWEPLGKDVTYHYSIKRTICSPYAVKEIMVTDKISASRVVLDMPLNKKGEFYTLYLEARKKDKIVGSLVVHEQNGFGWDYRFRVVPKPGPTRIISPIDKQQTQSP
jgi:hypothetical protein